jgi:hypothetical protein
MGQDQLSRLSDDVVGDLGSDTFLRRPSLSEPAVHEDGIRVEMRISHSVLLPRLDQLGPEGTQALEFLRNTGGTPILDYSKFAFGFEQNSTALVPTGA